MAGDVAHRSIRTLSLSERVVQLLESGGAHTVGDLVMLGKAGCLAIRGFGQRSLQEVRAELANLGLHLIGD